MRGFLDGFSAQSMKHQTPRDFSNPQMRRAYVTSKFAIELLTASNILDSSSTRYAPESLSALVDGDMAYGNLPCENTDEISKDQRYQLSYSKDEQDDQTTISGKCAELYRFLLWCRDRGLPIGQPLREMFNPPIPDWTRWLMQTSWLVEDAIWLLNECEPQVVDRDIPHSVPLPPDTEFAEVVKIGVEDGTLVASENGRIQPLIFAQFVSDRKMPLPPAMQIFLDKISGKHEIREDSSVGKSRQEKMETGGNAEQSDDSLSRKWSDYEMWFIQEGETLSVSYRGETKLRAPSELVGFIDGRNKTPNMNWELLTKLASSNGVLGRYTDFAPHEQDCVRSRVHRLSKALQQTFKIDESPFIQEGREYSSKEGKLESSWRAKFNINEDRPTKWRGSD